LLVSELLDHARLRIIYDINLDIEVPGETLDDSAVESHVSMLDWHPNVTVHFVWSAAMARIYE
jgi:hypothetical protein